MGVAALPTLNACSNDDDNSAVQGINPGDMGGETCDSATTPSETEGPFPTHNPSTLVTSDIRSDRTGINLQTNITIINTAGAAVANAIVDIWHCDKDGNYSEYGGSGMQSTNYTNVHFLRGRQTTDASGKVSFLTIFPGWYSGRATHIHVHVYNASGTSLLVTQIAFPEGTGTAVANVNGYSKGMNGYTYNAQDNVFSNSYQCETCTTSGNNIDGYSSESTITVNA